MIFHLPFIHVLFCWHRNSVSVTFVFLATNMIIVLWKSKIWLMTYLSAKSVLGFMGNPAQNEHTDVVCTLHRCILDIFFLLFALLFSSIVSFEEWWQWVVAVRVGCFAAGWHGRTHSELGVEQLRRGRAPNLVLSAQHPLPRRLPGRLSQVLQREEKPWRWRRDCPPFQRLSFLWSPQGRDLPREVACVSHAALHSGLLPTAALPQPDGGAVGSHSWCGTLA